MNTFDVIVGALIGMGVSLFTSLVSHWLENSRNKQSRSWQIEDRQKSAHSELLKERIKQIEDQINKLRDIALNVVQEEMLLMLVIKNVSAEEFKNLIVSENDSSFINLFSSLEDGNLDGDVVLKVSNKIIDLEKKIAESLNFVPFVVSLNVKNISEDFQKLYWSIITEMNNVRRLTSAINQKQNVDFKTEYFRIQKFLETLFILYGSLILDLDEKRASLN